LSRSLRMKASQCHFESEPLQLVMSSQPLLQINLLVLC